MLAHRAKLPEASFDESLRACVDWDLVLRLTRDRPPVALPVLASAYSVSAPARISDRPEPETVVPAFLRLVEERPESGRYRAADLLVGAGSTA